MTSVAVCPICHIAGCYHIRGASETRALREAMRLPEVPTDAQMHDACTSFRHDYGLLGDDERKAVQHQCKEWWRCVSRASGPKPTPAPTPDVWPWDAIDKRFKYAARDQDGDLTLFDDRPRTFESMWGADSNWRVVDFLNVTIGTCDWRDSLVVRPGYVEAGTFNRLKGLFADQYARDANAQDARRGTLNASEGQQ